MIAELLAVAGATREVIGDFGAVQPATRPGDAIRRHLLHDLPLGFRNPDTRTRWADADPDEWLTQRWTDITAVVPEEVPTQQLPAPGATTSETTDDIMETVDWPLGELADDDMAGLSEYESSDDEPSDSRHSEPEPTSSSSCMAWGLASSCCGPRMRTPSRR